MVIVEGSEELMSQWQANVLMCAQRYSRVMEERWQIEIQSGRAFLPDSLTGDGKHEEASVEMLTMYLDHMFGTAVALSGHYCSLSEEFENNIVAMVKDKFRILRDLKKETV